MKLVGDIRLFESDKPNVDGNTVPYYIGKLPLNDQNAPRLRFCRPGGARFLFYRVGSALLTLEAWS